MIWLLEPDVFAVDDHPLRQAALAEGHVCRSWRDDWWTTQEFPALEGPVVFHGSLGNAARVRALGRWQPGAYCDSSAFHGSAWYAQARDWLVHREFILTSVRELIADPLAVAGSLADSEGKVFVRPDSPLKPFSGRVVPLAGLTAAQLDHGFYYDDLDLAIVIAPVVRIASEWRFVVCEGQVVSGCRYEAEQRRAIGDALAPEPLAFARLLASRLVPPDPVYVLDLAEVDGELRLLELNPFSGADPYACAPQAIVRAVAELLSR